MTSRDWFALAVATMLIDTVASTLSTCAFHGKLNDRDASKADFCTKAQEAARDTLRDYASSDAYLNQPERVAGAARGLVLAVRYCRNNDALPDLGDAELAGRDQLRDALYQLIVEFEEPSR